MPEKPWYKSKTKWGVLLLGLAQVLPAAPIPEVQPWLPVLQAAGITLCGFGVRNALPATHPPGN